MHKVYTAANLPEAQIIVDLLQHQDIDASIFNANTIGAVGEIPVVEAYPEVWITQSQDFKKARDLIIDFEASSGDVLASKQCPYCGEDNPGSFDICWHCQHELE